MKSMKKLIPAIAMLIISAVLLSTASYAWFSMNTQVSVSSMTIKATASKNLLISGSTAGGADLGTYNPSLALTTNKTTLVPVSTHGTGNPTFYKLKDVGTGMAADNFAKSYNTTFEAATDDVHYVSETMYLKSTGTAASNLIATISYTGGTQALDPSIRLMLVIDGNRFYYTPVTGASTWAGISSISATDVNTACANSNGASAAGLALSGITYYTDSDCTVEAAGVVVGTTDVVSAGYYWIAPAGLATVGGTNVTPSTSGTTVILGSINADTAVRIDLYIWYEGQDTNCKSTNAVTLGTTVFTVNFSVAS